MVLDLLGCLTTVMYSNAAIAEAFFAKVAMILLLQIVLRCFLFKNDSYIDIIECCAHVPISC